MRFDRPDYAELLGLYLGDGYISRAGRTHRLRIFLDAKYPRVNLETSALLRRCFPDNSVGVSSVAGVSMVVFSVYSRHMPCLFPQHGVGPKHMRSIELESWQQRVVAEEPWALMRGMIRSDGCVFVNRTGPYEYLSYSFAGRSKGIVDAFVGACERVGIRCRVNYFHGRRMWHVRVNRRDDVATMLRHVGTKD